MKILQINAYYGYGSTGNIVKELCSFGNKLGHKMYAIYWLERNRLLEDDMVIYCGENAGIGKFRKMVQWIFDGGRLNYNLERTKKIVLKIQEIDPDVIHLHNLHGDFEFGSIHLEFLIEAISKLNKRIIWTFHDCWAITGRCYYFSYKECNRWKKGCGKCPQRLFDREGVWADKSNYNWGKKQELYKKLKDLTIITVSNWLQSIVKESMLKNRKCITIYNGIDTDVYVPRKRKEDGKFRILCIGWDRRKGYMDYYKLSKYLKDDEEIVVVGKRPMFRKVRRLPLNIKEIERANNKVEMCEIYNSCNVYFNASPAETFGLTTVEAMSCGIPAVGYDNTATTEVISSVEEQNMLAQNGDIEEVYKIINEIRKKKWNSQKLHERCYELFDKNGMLCRYFDVYEEQGDA